MHPSFIEQIDLRSAEYLNSQLSSDYLKTHVMNGEEERFTLHHVKNVLQKFIQGNGKFKSTYKKSVQDNNKQYRWYGDGIQGIPTKFRGLLCKNMTDIDMENAYPSIIYNLCMKNGIPCQYLKEYCENRKQILSKECTKTDIFKCINKKTKCKGSAWFMSFDYEMKQIQQAFILHFTEIYQQCVGKPNTIGSFMTSVCMYYENMFLEAIVKWIPNEVAVLMFDGLMVYGTVSKTILEDLTKLIQDNFQFTIKFSLKEHDNSIVVPDDFVCENPDDIYKNLKEKYENKYSLGFIQKSVSYSFKVNDQICFFSREQMHQMLQTDKVGNKTFFSLWLDDPFRKVYSDIGVFPHDIQADDGILNMWSGFQVERLQGDECIDPILNHIDIIMNHHKPSYEFFLDWLANLFQFPSSTSIFVSISSREGSGKSAIIDLLTYMIGADKSKEISDMSNELFGAFNEDLRDAILMNINEVERADACKCYERLKTQITSPTIRVHPKGQKPYTIRNLRKFISTNNSPHAIVIKEGSRRYFATESSNELIGDVNYFNEFYKFIKRPAVQYSFYKYLMSRPVKRQLTDIDIPKTSLMREAYVLNRDPIEDFILELENGVKLYTEELYVQYKQYMNRIGMEYTMNYKQFSMRFGRLMEGETKGKNNYIVDGVRDQRVFYVIGKFLEQATNEVVAVVAR
jgi:hypothetical protein